MKSLTIEDKEAMGFGPQHFENGFNPAIKKPHDPETVNDSQLPIVGLGIPKDSDDYIRRLNEKMSVQNRPDIVVFCYHGVGRSLRTVQDMSEFFPKLKFAYIGIQPILDGYVKGDRRAEILKILSNVPVIVSAINNPDQNVKDVLDEIKRNGNKNDEDIVSSTTGDIYAQLYKLIPERFPNLLKLDSQNISLAGTPTPDQHPQTPTATSTDTQTK